MTKRRFEESAGRVRLGEMELRLNVLSLFGMRWDEMRLGMKTLMAPSTACEVSDVLGHTNCNDTQQWSRAII